MKRERPYYEKGESSPGTQRSYWEESVPLPEFPPSPNVVVTPARVAPPTPKEKQQVTARLFQISPYVKHTFLSYFRYLIVFFLAASLALPAFFLGSFFLTRFLMEKKEKEVVPTPTLVSTSTPPPLQEIPILLPRRISSAFIPVPPSTIPSDLTKNWDSYTNPTLRFSFKYPKEWFLTEFPDSPSSILKLSYPVRSGQIGSFVAGEKAYMLLFQEEKQGATLEDVLSKRYNFSSIKKEEINVSGKRGWRFYNPKGRGEIMAFFEHGQKIISIESGVKDPMEIVVYQDLFLLIHHTFVFS